MCRGFVSAAGLTQGFFGVERGTGIVWCHWRMGHRDEEIVLRGWVELLLSSLGVLMGMMVLGKTWRIV